MAVLSAQEWWANNGLSVSDVLRQHRRRFPSQVAVVCGTQRLTYAQLDDRVNQTTNLLVERGLGEGDRLLWLGQNCHHAFELFLAAGRLGAMFCPANWRNSVSELRFVLADLEPKVVVWQAAEVGDKATALRQDWLAAGRDPRSWIRHDDELGEYEGCLRKQPTTWDVAAERPVDPAAPLLVIYTGAFTGTPRPSALNHVSLMIRALCEALWQEIDHDYSYLNNGPLFHVGNWRTLMPTFMMGGKNVFVRRGEPTELCRLVETERCNGAYLVPVTRNRMAEVNSDGSYDLSSLRDRTGSPEWLAMVSAGRDFAGYGQTETGGLVATTSYGPAGSGNAGHPLPISEVRIVDPAGVEVAAGEAGEIAVRGLTVSNGYLTECATDLRGYRNGWWHTGDIGRLEADGSVSFLGAGRRMLKSGSENIYPTEVEHCLQTHPGVKECAVIGTPDEQWDQSVLAVVVATEGVAVTEEELLQHCKQVIASYKKPRRIVFVAELPKVGGEVDYAELDRSFGGGGYPGAGAGQAIGARA